MIVTASGARLGVLSRRALPFHPTGIGVAMTVWYDPTYDDSIASAVQAVCDLKSHPAVLLWLVANEPNYEATGTSTADAVAAISDVVAAVQAADPSRPCSVVWGGVPSAAVLSQLAHVDLWGLNVYRGASFGTLFDEWAALSAKPMWLSEYGADSYSAAAAAENQTAHAREVGALAAEIAAHASAAGGVCAGGAIFAWADEWWKLSSGSPSVQETTSTWTQTGYFDEQMHEVRRPPPDRTYIARAGARPAQRASARVRL
jgi:hypothetical protein